MAVGPTSGPCRLVTVTQEGEVKPQCSRSVVSGRTQASRISRYWRSMALLF